MRELPREAKDQYFQHILLDKLIIIKYNYALEGEPSIKRRG